MPCPTRIPVKHDGSEAGTDERYIKTQFTFLKFVRAALFSFPGSFPRRALQC